MVIVHQFRHEPGQGSSFGMSTFYRQAPVGKLEAKNLGSASWCIHPSHRKRTDMPKSEAEDAPWMPSDP